jgi:hypothetical protein
MTYYELVSLVQWHMRDLGEAGVAPQIIRRFLLEAQRVMAADTLLLEAKSSSLTYSSANDGFALPTDFIKVKALIWLDSATGNHPIPQVGLEQLRELRNDWVSLNESSGQYLQPLGYAIQNGYIVLDSITQTSPTLYYYKYDTAMSGASSSPSFDSEYHSALADYAIWKLANDANAFQRWELTLKKMRASKFRQARTARTRFVGL